VRNQNPLEERESGWFRSGEMECGWEDTGVKRIISLVAHVIYMRHLQTIGIIDVHPLPFYFLNAFSAHKIERF